MDPQNQGFPPRKPRGHLLPNFVPDMAGAAPAVLPVPPGARTVLSMGRLHHSQGPRRSIGRLDPFARVACGHRRQGPERASLTDWRARPESPTACISLAGATTPPVLAAFFTCSSVPPAASRSATKFLKPFPRPPGRRRHGGRPRRTARRQPARHSRPGGQRHCTCRGIEGMLNNPAMAQGTASAGRAYVRAHFSETSWSPRGGIFPRAWPNPDVRHRRPGARPRRAPARSENLGENVRALGHRGPDGTAGAIAGQVALGHRRLAVIDVAGGIQPLIEGNTVMVANAEIYNTPKSAPSSVSEIHHQQRLRNPRCISGATAAPPSPIRYAACTPWRSTTASLAS